MMTIPPDFARRMVALYGTEGRSWLENLPELLEKCRRRWSLTLGAPFEGLSYNYVVRARDADGDPVVLKVGVPNHELLAEIDALGVYDGRGCARLLASDHELGAMVLERLTPGAMLVSVEYDEQATRIAADVMQQLWRPLPAQHSFPTIEKWSDGMQRLRSTFDGGTGPFPRRLVEAAERLFAELFASSREAVLLHGDLHHYNILTAQREPWLAIDPKGVSGEALYETGALLRNPVPYVATWPDLRQKLARRVDILSEHLQADRARIIGWGIAQAVLSSWWSYEDEGEVGEEALIIARALLEIDP